MVFIDPDADPVVVLMAEAGQEHSDPSEVMIFETIVTVGSDALQATEAGL